MLYPLRFEPLFRHYLWGGRRLKTVLGKSWGDKPYCAESWEIADHGEDQSRVAYGSLSGTSLRELCQRYGADLLGKNERFPLLFKFLDAHQNLSVQVHPNDGQAAQLEPPDLGKTEAWVILDALPGSVVYAGLKRGFDRPALQRELHRGTVELCLHRWAPQRGDCFFIPAGTIHALGGGLLVAEIQQASDTTFRLHDWNRTDAQGNPRPLHIEQGLQVIDFERGPVTPQQPKATDHPHCARLAECSKFILDRWSWDGAGEQTISIGGDKRFHILAVLEGEVWVENDAAGQPLCKGQTMLLPAALSANLQITRAATLLEMYPPL